MALDEGGNEPEASEESEEGLNSAEPEGRPGGVQGEAESEWVPEEEGAPEQEEGPEHEVPLEKAVASKHRLRTRTKVLIGVVAVVLVCVIGAFALFASGVVAPAGAAAKYSTLSYIDESEVTEYITTYKEQMGYGDASDEEWASFMTAYNLTPERLRLSTINQLIDDRVIDKWGEKLGITVSDDDLNAYIESMKNTYAFNDDDTWQKTLDMYGRTEDELKETYRHTLVKQQVYTEEVPMPEVDDETFKQYLYGVTSSFSTNKVKHSYCFKISGLDEGGSTEKLAKVQEYRKALLKHGATEENFQALVTTASDVSSLVDTGGANGWSCDTSSYSSKYIQVLESTKVGEVSSVFNDGDGYAFIWVDQKYTLPTSQEKAQNVDLDKMPSSLHDYLSDLIAYSLWEQDCSEWLNDQVQEENVIVFDMPSDVPYNVDMSLAQTGDDSSGDSDSSTSDSSASSADSSSSTSDSSASSSESSASSS